MKKLLCLATVVALLLSFNACAKEDPATGVDVETVFSSTATIEGFAYVNISKSSADATAMPFAPEGTVLSFIITNEDLGINGGVTYGTDPMTGAPVVTPNPAEGSYIKTTTVQADGTYSIEMPVRNDGQSVEVKITSAQLAMDVNLGDVNQKYMFELNNEKVAAFVKNGSYKKSLIFQYADTLSTTGDWEEAVYSAELLYHNGKDDVLVPAGTQIRIAIAGSEFVPERADSVIQIVSLAEAGKLEFKFPAPKLAINPDGLPFVMTSAFIAESISISGGKEVVSQRVYKMDREGGVLYGGKTNNVGEKRYEASTVTEAGKAVAWKAATYTVKLRYNKDLQQADLSSLPEGAVVTVTTTNRNTIDSSLEEIVFTTTATNPLEFTIQAPDPATSATALTFDLEIDFITDITNASDEKETYKYTGKFKTDETIWGGINKKGSTNDDNTLDVSSKGAAL